MAPRKLPSAVVPSALSKDAIPARKAIFRTCLKSISVMLVTVERYPTTATITAEITAPYKSFRLSFKIEDMFFCFTLSIEAIDNYTTPSYHRHNYYAHLPI